VNRNYRPLEDSATQKAISIRQAVENSNALGRLAALVEESSHRLCLVAPIIPATLRAAIKAGPIEGNAWCLLVTSNAAAAKLRQLSPLLISKLASEGITVDSIRLKILTAKR
jgi:hypothetical protein